MGHVAGTGKINAYRILVGNTEGKKPHRIHRGTCEAEFKI
jgi:hypothetical protein